jgi:hypothetical protein
MPCVSGLRTNKSRQFAALEPSPNSGRPPLVPMLKTWECRPAEPVAAWIAARGAQKPPAQRPSDGDGSDEGGKSHPARHGALLRRSDCPRGFRVCRTIGPHRHARSASDRQQLDPGPMPARPRQQRAICPISIPGIRSVGPPEIEPRPEGKIAVHRGRSAETGCAGRPPSAARALDPADASGFQAHGQRGRILRASSFPMAREAARKVRVAGSY